jgi:hypothetical protein
LRQTGLLVVVAAEEEVNSQIDLLFLDICKLNIRLIVYDPGKTYGLIVDYCGITRDLGKALAIFEEEDIKGALEPAEKNLKS